jgi:methylamine---glutamate N-methyltransferase subunit C
MMWFFSSLLGGLGALAVVALGAFLLRSVFLNWVVDRTLVRLLKDRYAENLWDIVVGMTRVPPHILMELELRAEFGQTLERPLGSIRRLPDFAGVAFNPAQLVKQPLGPEAPVDLTTILGPLSLRPLRLDMPILISAMGYGVALSKSLVLALARGASQAGTAYNAGSGPVLDEILKETRHLILQYSGGSWNRDENLLAQADMVEIRYGHGARAALGRVISGSQLPPEARNLMGITAGDEAIMSAPLPGAGTPAELRRLVPELRNLIDGGPVGVKLAATHDLERELEAILEAGVDIIAIDGSQGGTQGAPPIIADDFGIPTLHALHRAVLFLERSGSRRDVSLVISGGLRTPGEFLKALALGADAVYVGTAAMMAATHGSLSKAVPLEPVTQIAWASGKHAQEFDPELGAETVKNFLMACAGELTEAARALGKKSIRDVCREDLVALDRETAEVLGLSPAWRAPASLPAADGKPGHRT